MTAAAARLAPPRAVTRADELGRLSHQIEHHLFPDLPSSRYAEMAPEVRALVERHGLRYHAAPLPRQVASAWHKVLRLSLPNDW